MTIPELHDAERFRDFIPRDDPFLNELEKESRDRDIPIIGPHIGKLLFILVKATGAKRILELGTANGYSSIWMAKALGQMHVNAREMDEGTNRKSSGEKLDTEECRRELGRGKIITIEWDPKMAEEAERNIGKAGYGDHVKVLQGDARELLTLMEGEYFDMIFMDVEKEFYSELLDPAVTFLRPGGLMIFDNTAFTTAGDFLDISSEHAALDTIHMYGFFPNHGPEFDAITLCVKNSSLSERVSK